MNRALVHRVVPLAAVVCVAAGVALAPSLGISSAALAAEKPPTPNLRGFHPDSPGIATTPRLYGTFGLISTSVVGPMGLSVGPVTAVEGEPTLIQIFEGQHCPGVPVASGTASEFEGTGIKVTAVAGTTTTFSAVAENAQGVSDCSSSIDYRQVEEPPAVPTLSGSVPLSPADNNAPHLTGVADQGSIVSIYTDPSCLSAPVASGAATAFGSTGIAVPVADNTTTTFYAQASWAGLPSGCSASSVTFQEVTAPAPPVEEPTGGGGTGPGGGSGGDTGGGTGGTGAPAPAIGPAKPVPANPPAPPSLKTLPGGRAHDTTPLVSGSSPRADSVDLFAGADCSGQPIASTSASAFAAGVQVQVVPNGEATFSAKGRNGAGASRCSDPVAYYEDSTPPLTRITFGPGVKTRKQVAVFRFADTTDDPPGTAFLCKFDKRPWRACQSPMRIPHLKRRSHILRVKAIDAAGNEEATAQHRRFTVIGGGK